MKKIIIFLIAIVSFAAATAQINWLPDGKFGTKTGGIGVTRALFFPTGCGNPDTLIVKDSALKQGAIYLDSCNHRTWVYDPKLKAWDSLHLGVTSSSGGGSGSGIESLGTTGNYGLIRINDSTYKVDSATLAALFLRRADSALSYITPKRLADSMATKKDFYKEDGAFTSDRTVDGNTKFLQINNLADLFLEANNNAIIGGLGTGNLLYGPDWAIQNKLYLQNPTAGAGNKMLTWSTITEEVTYTDIPAGGIGSGIESLGTTGNLCLTRINDSTYAVDTACLAALFLRRADSAAYVTINRLADSMATNNLYAVTNRGNNTNLNYTHNIDYIDEGFAGSSLPTGWANGGSPSYTVSGGKINFSGVGGGGAFDTYVYNNAGILMDKTITSATMTVNEVPAATTYGVAIGFQSYNTNGYNTSVRAGLVTSSTDVNYGKAFIETGTSTFFYSDSLNTDINNGDIINIKLIQLGWIYSVVINNYTQGWQLRHSLIITNYDNPFVGQNSSYATIYHLGGSFSVDSFKYTITAPSFTDIILIGNSITYGQEASHMEERWANMTGNYDNNIVSGGGGDVTDNIKSRLGEVVAIHPKRVLLHDISGNDILFAVPAATWQANLIYIRDSLVRAGIEVIWTNGSPRTGTDETAQKNFIEANFKSDLIIDTWNTMLGTGTNINAAYTTDGVHYNDLGMAVFADKINMQLGYKKQPLQIASRIINATPTSVLFVGGNSDIQQAPHFNYDSVLEIITVPIYKSRETSTGVTGTWKTIGLVGNTAFPQTQVDIFGSSETSVKFAVMPGNATGGTQKTSQFILGTNTDVLQGSSKQTWIETTTGISKYTTYTAGTTANALDIHFGGNLGNENDSKFIIKTDGVTGVGRTPSELAAASGYKFQVQGNIYTIGNIKAGGLTVDAGVKSVRLKSDSTFSLADTTTFSAGFGLMLTGTYPNIHYIVDSSEVATLTALRDSAAAIRAAGGGGGGSMVYPAAGIAVSTGSAWTTSITDNSSNWNTAYTDRLKWDGGATGLTASTGRTSLGGTTIGQNIFTSTNPSAITFLRGNADNSVDWLSASAFRTAIGAVNLAEADLTQTGGLREYTLGYFNASGDRYLSFGKANYTENANILINANSTNHNGFIQIFAKDSTNGLQISETISPNGNRKYTTLSQSSLTTTISYYMDSSTIVYTGATKLRYNFGKDTFGIKGNMPISASSTDSVLVRENGVIKLRAQSDIAGGGGLSSTNFVFNESFTGSTSSTYTLANTPTAGTVQVFKNGILLEPTTDYSVSGTTVTLVAARLSGDVFLNHYLK